MRELVASLGGRHNAKIKRVWRGSWESFVDLLIRHVPEQSAKDKVGWVSGAEFDPAYRDGDNFVARHFLSFDYDHISTHDYERIVGAIPTGPACLAYTTWSHTDDRPRLRLWYPLQRAAGYDEFQAISRKIASATGIELAARESHVPAQYMYRPSIKPGGKFQYWENLEGPWIDVDKTLGEYDDWTKREQWPHRLEGDGVHSEGSSVDPRTKPGIIGAFCRAFPISGAIERFNLPYVRSGSEGRWTYVGGSRPEGAIVYDEDTKLHSHHDTDPARGQSNAYDLVRLHHFGWSDEGRDDPLSERPSSRAMAAMARELPELRSYFISDAEFDDLDAIGTWDDAPDAGPVDAQSVERGAVAGLPAEIAKPTTDLSDLGNARRIQTRYGRRLVAVGSVFFHWTFP